MLQYTAAARARAQTTSAETCTDASLREQGERRGCADLSHARARRRDKPWGRGASCGSAGIRANPKLAAGPVGARTSPRGPCGHADAAGAAGDAWKPAHQRTVTSACRELFARSRGHRGRALRFGGAPTTFRAGARSWPSLRRSCAWNGLRVLSGETSPRANRRVAHGPSPATASFAHPEGTQEAASRARWAQVCFRALGSNPLNSS